MLITITMAKSIAMLDEKFQNGKDAFAKAIWRRYIQTKLVNHYMRQFKKRGPTLDRRLHNKLRHIMVFKGLTQLG